MAVDVQREVAQALDDVLSLQGRSRGFSRDTPLLGSVAELDSMAVVTLITTIEDRFGIVLGDDEIDGSTFATLGSLTDLVASKLAS